MLGKTGLFLTCLVMANSLLRAQDFPQFRGTGGARAVEWAVDSDDLVGRAKCGLEDQSAWLGWSQPIVWGDRLFVTTAVA